MWASFLPTKKIPFLSKEQHGNVWQKLIEFSITFNPCNKVIFRQKPGIDSKKSIPENLFSQNNAITKFCDLHFVIICDRFYYFVICDLWFCGLWFVILWSFFVIALFCDIFVTHFFCGEFFLSRNNNNIIRYYFFFCENKFSGVDYYIRLQACN